MSEDIVMLGDKILAHARTFDGYTVSLLDSGLLVLQDGKRVGYWGRARTDATKARTVHAGRLVLELAPELEQSEIGRVYGVARDITARSPGATVEYLRSELKRFAETLPYWEVIRDTYDGGKITGRLWRFPSISMLRGLGILHFPGRYKVMRCSPSFTKDYSDLIDTGFESRDVDEAKSQAFMVAIQDNKEKR